MSVKAYACEIWGFHGSEDVYYGLQSALKLEVTCSSEMLVTTYHTAWFHNLED
jgi:hypothetical protein